MRYYGAAGTWRFGLSAVSTVCMPSQVCSDIKLSSGASAAVCLLGEALGRYSY